MRASFNIRLSLLGRLWRWWWGRLVAAVGPTEQQVQQQQLQQRVKQLEDLSHYDLSTVLNLRGELRTYKAMICAIVEAQGFVRIPDAAISAHLGPGQSQLHQGFDPATKEHLLTVVWHGRR